MPTLYVSQRYVGYTCWQWSKEFENILSLPLAKSCMVSLPQHPRCWLPKWIYVSKMWWTTNKCGLRCNIFSFSPSAPAKWWSVTIYRWTSTTTRKVHIWCYLPLDSVFMLSWLLCKYHLSALFTKGFSLTIANVASFWRPMLPLLLTMMCSPDTLLQMWTILWHVWQNIVLF